jgi:hypothetical protein
LTDFGLPKDGPCGDGRNVSTSWFMGMQGYVAPEYVAPVFSGSIIYCFLDILMPYND